ncbi:MAG: hypothetical protein OWT28_01985 [Firmicutes bacterium]|nr:hypothetical protein [Bacillota bacterium]
MYMLPGLPAVQSHPVSSVSDGSSKGLHRDAWRTLTPSPTAVQKDQTRTSNNLDPYKGQRFDAFA